MSEDEIIKEMESLSPSEQAIQGLLDLYNKEKEKNEDLQIKVKYYEDIMIKQNVEREFKTLYTNLHRIVKTEYIHKDKIRDLIHSYSITDERFMKYLQELLEERN